MGALERLNPEKDFDTIEAFATVFVPTCYIEKYIGSQSSFAIPAASVLGIPLYMRIEMSIPLLKVLLGKGMGFGAAMALLIGGTGASTVLNITALKKHGNNKVNSS